MQWCSYLHAKVSEGLATEVAFCCTSELWPTLLSLYSLRLYPVDTKEKRMWLIMRSLLCLPLHFANSLMHYTCLFIDCHRGRAKKIFSISMSHSWRPSSHSYFWYVSLSCMSWGWQLCNGCSMTSSSLYELRACQSVTQELVLFQCAPVNHAPLK